MKFGIREVCDVTFDWISGTGPGNFTINTAKMSTLESTSTTVYAQGGQGYSRLMAWEGEKTLTFTIEDALIDMDSFHALTGATYDDKTSGSKYSFKIYPTSFAGFYKVTATTLFRDETGADHPATIIIPRAKIQTTLNLSMAPTGDPSSFTFTLDAFPSTTEGENRLLFSLEVDQGTRDNNSVANTTTVNITYTNASNQSTTKELTTTNETPKLEVDTDGTISLTGATDTSPLTLTSDQVLTNLITTLRKGTTKATSTLTKGSTYQFYII